MTSNPVDVDVTTPLVVGDDDTSTGGKEAEEDSSASAQLQMTTLESSSVTTVTSSSRDWFSLWKLRLITSEDPFSVHKLSAIVYTLTSFALMGTAAARWLVGRQELFAVLPDYVIPVTYLFCLSTLIMCTVSIRMAFLHRRDDLASRNAFIGTAGSSIFSAYFLLWASPFAPDVLTTPLASQLGFGILVLWNLISIGDTMIRASELIEGRREKAAAAAGRGSADGDDENASFIVEYLRYIFPVAWGLPLVASTGYIAVVAHDHAWYMSLFDYVQDTYGHGLEASVFYNNVLVNMAAAYGTLFVTLRDKRLISKRVEWVGISLFSVPALLWTIDVSVRILPYAFGSSSPWDG